MKISKNITPLIVLIILFLSSCASSSENPRINAARFSPDGQYLIFSIKYQDRSNIYQMRKDGTGLIKLTLSPGYDFDPVYSPDGSKIVFSRICSSRYSDPANIYIMNSDGSKITQLTFDNTSDTSPVFSPDGGYIYFVRAQWFGHSSLLASSSWKNKDIYSIKPDGSELKAITSQSFYEISEPSISPDGKEILVSLTIYKNPDSLWLIPINDPKAMIVLRPNLRHYISHDNINHLEKSAYENISGPQLSSDGKMLLFQWSSKSMGLGYYVYELYIMNLENNNVRQLTNLKRNATSGFFSPDGKEIVFLFNPKWPKGNLSELWTISSDGTNPHSININLQKME